jgi:hypothetical protein
MAASSGPWHSFKPESIRGAPGFFRVAQTREGKWWWVDPEDTPCFIRAVNGVRSAGEPAADPVLRLRAWGFNALGADCDEALSAEGLPVVSTVGFAEFCAIRAKGVRLPDVFDPGWKAAAEERAGDVCAASARRPELLGWLTDDDLAWGGIMGTNTPALLQICLSLEPSFAAYHAAWEFVLAPYRGDLKRLGKAWGWPLHNKEEVRELTRGDQGITSAGFARDQWRWTHEFAQRYFAVTGAVIRRHDAQHLILGAREPTTAVSGGGAWLSECVFPAVDVTWVRGSDLKTWREGPVLVGQFNWVPESLEPRASKSRRGGVTTVERMLRQGRATFRALAAHPLVVGYAWESWRDRPGEQPPFGHGLVHDNNSEAREHTELLTYLNGEWMKAADLSRNDAVES